jgi:predicted nucleotidyltransferase
MAITTIESLMIPEESKEFLQEYLRRLKQALRQNVEGIVLFGSVARGDFVATRSNLNVFVLCREVSGTVLREAGTVQKKWGRQLIVPPLMMTREELEQSCEIFPLEYLLIKESHILLEGRDPFPELHVSLDHLGHYCEKEVMSNFIQIRQRFLEGEARPEVVQAILILSITSLLPVLRGILRLLKQSSQGKDLEILDRCSPVLAYEMGGLSEALKIKRGLSSPGALEWLKVFERYLLALDGLRERVQALRREGRL